MGDDADGRMGRDEHFARQGFPTPVIDPVARGRSATDPSTINSVKLAKTPPDRLPAIFSGGCSIGLVKLAVRPHGSRRLCNALTSNLR